MTSTVPGTITSVTAIPTPRQSQPAAGVIAGLEKAARAPEIAHTNAQITSVMNTALESRDQSEDAVARRDPPGACEAG